MTTSADFKLHSVQAVMFTPLQGAAFKTSKVIATVLRSFSQRYDGDIDSSPHTENTKSIQIGPVHKGLVRVRVGAPDVVLTSFDERWRLESSPVRTDSIWVARDDTDRSRSLADVVPDCLGPLLEYPVSRGVSVGRIALVVNRVVPLPDPAHVLSAKFCKSEYVDENSVSAPLRHSRAFRIENLKQYDSHSLGQRVNSWFKCFGGEHDDMEAPSIILEQDLNTLLEVADKTSFDKPQIQQFFDAAPSELNNILGLYFQ